MQFIDGLTRVLFQDGYGRVDYPGKLLFIKNMETRWTLIQVIPEPLRGQERKDYSRMDKELKQIANQLMIKNNRCVEYLSIAIFQGIPDEKTKDELASIANSWTIDSAEGRLFIYENQPSDFYGLKDKLEMFMTSFAVEEKEEKRLEWKASFPPVNTALVAINVLVFVALWFLTEVRGDYSLLQKGVLSWNELILQGQYYRILTAMFIHFGWDHLLQNMLMLIIMGSRLENLIGKARYLIVYVGSGIVGGLFSIAFTLASDPNTVAAGASGAIFGIMGGLAVMIFKDLMDGERHRIREIGIFGIVFMVCSALAAGFFMPNVDNMAHLGGLIGGVVLTFLLSIGL